MMYLLYLSPRARRSLRGPSDGRPPGHSDGGPRGPRTWGRVGPGPGPAHERINSYSAQEGINSKGNIVVIYDTLFIAYTMLRLCMYIPVY